MMKQVMPLMKTLTFNVICSLMLSIEQGTDRDILVKFFEDTIRGILSVPLNLPFTRFNRSLKANAKVKSIIMDLIKEERAALKQNGTSPNQDLITCLLSWSGFWLKIHPSMELVFMIYIYIYKYINAEQKEIAKSRTYGEPVTWEDLMKMKYTWRVTTETLRITPPVLFL
ncbi:hypothetical protein LguiA_015126 [Lonicera macranthoides]